MISDAEYTELVENCRRAEREARNAKGHWKKIKEQEAIAAWQELRKAQVEREGKAA